MNRISVFLMYAVITCLFPLYARETDTKTTFAGFAYFQIGQLVKSSDPEGLGTGMPDRAWDQNFNTRFTLDAEVRERLRIIGGVEMGIKTFAKGKTGGNEVTMGASLKEAQGIYTFGDDSKNPLLQIALGYFPFKYNPQATNMGEYLFGYRTGCYAPYIINDFDNCKSRLLGLRVSSVLSGILKQDLLLTSETLVGGGNLPVGDYTLSYLAGYNFKNMLDMGVGVSLFRLIPLDRSQTNSTDEPVRDIVGDPVVKNGDTLYLTSQALKLAARMTFDPKRLMPSEIQSVFGKEDCKLYGETAILGVKNYNHYIDSVAYYDDIRKRWPVMIGINFPCFKILDVVSGELEHFGWLNDISILKTPTPFSTMDEFSRQQRWRWSLYSQKTVTKGFQIRGLVGKDHYRSIDAGGGATAAEYLRGAGNWHYNLRIIFSF